MSSELTDHQKKLQIENEKLNQAYRDLFKVKGISKTRLEAARKRVLKDLEDIVFQQTHYPDEKGHYCPYKAAIEDGGRRMAKDMRKRIFSSPREDLNQKKPKVNKA